jgi:hypothetical protein
MLARDVVEALSPALSPLVESSSPAD